MIYYCIDAGRHGNQLLNAIQRIYCSLLFGQKVLSSSVSSSEEKGVLSKIIDMIHDEFAFDGYLDDGVEDVNMGKNHTSTIFKCTLCHLWLIVW